MSESVWHQDAKSEGPSRNEDARLVGRARGDVGSSASSEQQFVESAMGPRPSIEISPGTGAC